MLLCDVTQERNRIEGVLPQNVCNHGGPVPIPRDLPGLLPIFYQLVQPKGCQWGVTKPGDDFPVINFIPHLGDIPAPPRWAALGPGQDLGVPLGRERCLEGGRELPHGVAGPGL